MSGPSNAGETDPDSGLTGELPTVSVAAGRAALAATRFDRREVSLRNGLIAAIPVAAMMSLGTAVGQPAAAVTLGVGALLVGMSWLAGTAPANPPIGTMAADAVVLALATAAGTVAGQSVPVHLVLLFGLCLLAGLATVLGRRGIVIGTQSIVAYVILGAFPEPLPQALALGGLVLLGGISQCVFVALVASPLAFRRQRGALADAYRHLAAQVRNPLAPAASVGEALDQAELALSVPALFADPQLPGLTAMVSEGRRIRLECAALAAVFSYLRRTDQNWRQTYERTVQPALERIAGTLALVAAALDGGMPEAATLVDAALALGAWGAQREQLPVVVLEHHIAALTGQANGAARQLLLASGLSTDYAGNWVLPQEAPARRGRLPRPTVGSRARLLGVVRADFQKLRDSARLDSPAGRHAVRLAVVVSGTELLSRVVILPHGDWAVLAAATVLRPGFGATFTRGAERVTGTLAGVVLATLTAVALNPGGWGVVAVVAGLTYLTFATFPASFTLGVAGLTAVVVFLIHAVAPGTVQLALDRGLDTLIGGAIGLAAYALWPTWSARALPHRLSDLIDAQSDYLAAVLAALDSGRRPAAEQMRPLARRARLAWGDTEATLTVARTEPVHAATGPTAAARMLGALRRFVYGVHALRVGASKLEPLRPNPQLAPLGSALLDAVASVRGRLLDEPVPALPPLRSLYRRVDWAGLPDSVRIPLDELIDAVDSLAAALGMELPTEH